MSGEEQRDPAGRSLVKRRKESELTFLSRGYAARARAPTTRACSQVKKNLADVARSFVIVHADYQDTRECEFIIHVSHFRINFPRYDR